MPFRHPAKVTTFTVEIPRLFRGGIVAEAQINGTERADFNDKQLPCLRIVRNAVKYPIQLLRWEHAH